MNKSKPKPIIDRDLGTKRQCISELRRALYEASICLDGKALFTAIVCLEMSIARIQKSLPPQKIVKPLKK